MALYYDEILRRLSKIVEEESSIEDLHDHTNVMSDFKDK